MTRWAGFAVYAGQMEIDRGGFHDLFVVGLACDGKSSPCRDGGGKTFGWRAEAWLAMKSPDMTLPLGTWVGAEALLGLSLWSKTCEHSSVAVIGVAVLDDSVQRTRAD
jgi:hypothetical protein